MAYKMREERIQGQRYFRRELPVFVNRASETFELNEHSHDFVEIAYVAEGKGFHYIGGDVVPVRQGDMFYIPVGMSHVFRPSDGSSKRPLIVYNCIFSLELFDRIIDSHSLLLPSEDADTLLAVRASNGWLRVEDKLPYEAGHFMRKLHQEYALRQNGRSLMLVTYVIQLLLLLIRGLGSQDPKASTASDSRIEEALRHLRRHLDDPPPLAELAAMANIGPRQFLRLFKRATGQTYVEYTHSLLIERCCELLAETDRKVFEIAEMAGFNDMKHFHLVFKRKTGCTPLQFRKSRKVQP